MTESTLLKLGTAVVSDALDRLDIAGQCHGLMCQTARSFAGPAWTVRYLPVTKGHGSIGDFIDDVAAGSVVTIDNGGRTDCTVWGGLMTATAIRRGVAATVIDGVHRDSAIISRLGYSLFSRGSYMRTGKDRLDLEAIQVPIRLGGVTVSPGDMILGDLDGVIVIPLADVDRVVAISESILAAEDRISRAVEAGSRLSDARDQTGYRELQRRDR